MKGFFKNKNFKNLIFGILFFIGIVIFPSIWYLILAILIIAIMLDSVKNDSPQKNSFDGKNSGLNYEDSSLQELETVREGLMEELDKLESKNEKDLDYSKLQKFARRMPDLVNEVQTPKTFLQIIGSLGNGAYSCYLKGLLDSKGENNKEFHFLVDQFDREKKVCDHFFDGKEYMKSWVIFRSLQRKGISEEEFNKFFPSYVYLIEEIRKKKWEDIAWAWFINDKVDEIYGYDSCTKDRFLKEEKNYTKEFKTIFLNNLKDADKKNYKLLTIPDLELEKEIDEKISDDFYNSLSDNDLIIGKKKPNKIPSKVDWKLEDAINFGQEVWNVYAFLEVPDLNGLGIEPNEIRKKQLRLAGNFTDDEIFRNYLGKEFLDTFHIENIDRVRDFLKFEMFDEDRIQTAIKNEDIERIIFYSFIELPKMTLVNVECNDEIHISDPAKRAPYFAIMHYQMVIILVLMSSLGIFDSKEELIKMWIQNQITDPLDKDGLCLALRKNAENDERFVNEIYLGLSRILEVIFLNYSKFESNPEIIISTVEKVFFEVLSNYFLKTPESAFEIMKTIDKELKT